MNPQEHSKAKCKRQRDNWKARCEVARSALRVLHTWASYRSGCEMVPRCVVELCDKALKESEP